MTATFRWRTRFRKSGRLRFLSHLEVARALERSVRRADLPFAITQGFSPRMRIAFGPALPVGTAGDAEFFDVWLRRFERPAEVHRALQAATPPDLAPLEGRFVEDSRASLSSALGAARYEVVLLGLGQEAGEVAEALGEVASRDVLEVPHKGRTRTFDPSAELVEQPSAAARGADAVASIVLRLGAQGSLRPDALVTAALEYSGARTAQLVVTRTGLLEERDGSLVDPLE